VDESHRILILNASPDTCEMLEEYFRDRGWDPACAPTRALREGSVAGAELVRQYQPAVIVFDVAIPYEANWAVAQRLRDDPDVTCPIVVTTTNEMAVRRLIGVEARVHEVVGKPYDLDQLYAAVSRELTGEPAATLLPHIERRRGERRQADRRTSRREERDSAEDRPDW
jgi:DNA-binding response OmpR family regulator